MCLGHQAIGAAFGGRVIRAPQVMHGKTSEIHHDGKTIFRELPQDFPATRYHSLIVERKSLPRTLEISAETADGTIMGLRHRKMKVEGVQFHPESVLTGPGFKLLENFLESSFRLAELSHVPQGRGTATPGEDAGLDCGRCRVELGLLRKRDESVELFPRRARIDRFRGDAHPVAENPPRGRRQPRPPRHSPARCRDAAPCSR